MALLSQGVRLAALVEDGEVSAMVTVVRSYQAYGGVKMLVVVPTHEASDPGASFIECSEATARVAWSVF